jgi:hypothetical protein
MKAELLKMAAEMRERREPAFGDVLYAWSDRLEALAATTRGTEVRKAVLTAPERIWLQISEDEDHYNESFPHHVGEEITWCQDSVLACEVEYVRADLACRSKMLGGGA